MEERLQKEYKEKIVAMLNLHDIQIDPESGKIYASDKRKIQLKIAEQNNKRYKIFERKYKKCLATPKEIVIERIKPKLIEVTSKEDMELWKYATSFWSVPVTKGCGRRLRFLIFDENNNKLMGILGLRDPLIGLKVRDEYIGWDRETRLEKLYHVMTAYVLGAVPPYNRILGGKLVALLCKSDVILKAFKKRYTGRKTVIRGVEKPSELVLIDTMGAFGKSTIYNRLKGWKFVGYTTGQTHLHLTVPELWEIIKEIVPEKEFKTYRFGEGSNWKLRVTRKALQLLGFSKDILTTGWQRGYYICPLASNWCEYLLGEVEHPEYTVETVEELTQYWLKRWALPRKERLIEKLFEQSENIDS
ncbi:hypothetical protein Calkr_0701 [Caldicellulosiruptor acetigenus I77R1B]|uniref:DUF4338 domain-containing protein n=2 Tax=Caldicellulosiruptor acetigenus TaxID=301953 RepID=G2PT81_9FIRM|nr:Druantia anti-phage system protein DruA [Caldicellulosiruptor acetigenus]ADQ40233.1 hypothetical protein Calkr_0701 [Caldicellulosiruptor acetigenus I77R1B]AEM74240.1 hypothetical protein Calla_1641 [Caldicellulosiruptor acetigenus 6A]